MTLRLVDLPSVVNRLKIARDERGLTTKLLLMCTHEPIYKTDFRIFLRICASPLDEKQKQTHLPTLFFGDDAQFRTDKNFKRPLWLPKSNFQWVPFPPDDPAGYFRLLSRIRMETQDMMERLLSL